MARKKAYQGRIAQMPNALALASIARGSLCPSSFAAQIASGDIETFAHEHHHYLQLISTPFGFHHLLVDWDKVNSLYYALRKLAAIRPRLQIPLARHLPIDALAEIDESIAISFFQSLTLDQYSRWLMDGSLPTLQDESEIGPFYAAGYLSPIHLLQCYGAPTWVLDMPAAEEEIAPSVKRCNIMPSLGGLRVTTRMILECSATASSAMPLSESASDLICGIRDRKPADYYHLLDQVHCTVSPNAEALPFVLLFNMIADLSMFGIYMPGQPGYYTTLKRWGEVHPAMRFVTIVAFLGSNRDFVERFLSTHSAWGDDYSDDMDAVASHLGWPVPSKQIAEWDWSQYDRLPQFFRWAIDEIKRGYNKRREGSLHAAIQLYGKSFHESLFMYQIDSDIPFSEFASERFRSEMQNTLQLPGHGNDALRGIEYYMPFWYYSSLFAHQLLNCDYLAYDLQFISRRYIADHFFTCTGFKTHQIYR